MKGINWKTLSKSLLEEGSGNNDNNKTPTAYNRQEKLLLTLPWLWTILVALFSLPGSCPLFWSWELTAELS